MRFMYQGQEVVLMLQRYAIDSPWIKEYMHYLEENHFFMIDNMLLCWQIEVHALRIRY